MDATEWQFYRARTIARTLIEGTTAEQYAHLRDYCAKLLRSNPGLTVLIKCTMDGPNSKPCFERIYICLAALKEGWIGGCRWIISLDGCFIKGTLNGQLLTAVGVDPNNQTFPVAYAVVEAECRSSWL